MPLASTSEAIVAVYATAVNRADVLQRRGRYPPPPGETSILGLEAAGVVQGGVQHGKRVMTLLAGGGYAEKVAVDRRLLMEVPDSLSLTDAAAVPETWLTAFQLLFHVAQAKRGEKVLIHACGSGVGLAATQLAVRAGLHVFGTGGEATKRELCLALGGTAAFDYREEGSFTDGVLRATGGKGVDVILDCVGGAHVAANSAVLAEGARWVCYGLLGGAKVPGDAPLLASLLARRASLLTSTLRGRDLDYKRALTHEFAQHALPLFATGQYKVVVDSTFPLEEAQLAHERMERNQNVGKIVLLVGWPPEELERDVKGL